MKRGFILGKFMPPHAGHQFLIDSARAMVDELTILVCWLPDDPIPGPLRVQWMRELAPNCRIVHHGHPVPQMPADSPAFWPIWRQIVAEAHPKPIDFLFAGESYGQALAREVGGQFVPLGARILTADGLGGVSATAIRADPWKQWRWLPAPVRAHSTQTIVLHGVESTGKSILAERLARHFDTVWVPEYGRAHAESFGGEMDEDDLLLIGDAQSAMIDAGKRIANRRLFADTDALMTAAWARMMIGHVPPALLTRPKADLYLLLEPDTDWVDDGTRIYGDDAQRKQFATLCRNMLQDHDVSWISLRGGWENRFDQAVAAIEAMIPPGTTQGFDLSKENE